MTIETTAAANVLRPLLYHELHRAFGRVRVVHAGEPCVADVVHSPASRSGRRLQIIEWGESYAVDCPYCGDARGSLYVNHFWSPFDANARRQTSFAAVDVLPELDN